MTVQQLIETLKDAPEWAWEDQDIDDLEHLRWRLKKLLYIIELSIAADEANREG